MPTTRRACHTTEADTEDRRSEVEAEVEEEGTVAIDMEGEVEEVDSDKRDGGAERDGKDESTGADERDECISSIRIHAV